MFNWISLLYAIPMIVAMVVAGAIVGPRINAAARTLLWSGIVLLSVTQVAPVFTVYLAMERSLMGVFQAVTTVMFVVHAIGVVLLIVASGRAARGNEPPRGGWGGHGYPIAGVDQRFPSGDPGTGYSGGPGAAGPTHPPYPNQPGQGYPSGPTSQPGYPAQGSAQAGQPGYPPQLSGESEHLRYGQPGQWGNDQRR
ncbi:MAG: hypothetical protein QM695_06450 [Micropruina sp.]